MPYFSLIIPTYNRADLIQATIHSALNQEYEDFEIIVVDDGSEDNTEEIIKQIADTRISYFKKKNEERGAARNYGIQKARGKYISFLDSDDLLYPNHFLTAYNLIKDTNHDICVLSYQIKSSNGTTRNIYLPELINNKLLKGNLISCNSIFIKKEIILSFPFETERKFKGGEDWALWLKLASRYKIYGSPIITSCIIDHDQRSVKNHEEKSLIFNAEYLHNLLAEDKEFIKVFGNRAPKKILAHMYTYASLHLVMSNKNSAALEWLLKGIIINPVELLTRRTLAIFKITLLNFINMIKQ